MSMTRSEIQDVVEGMIARTDKESVILNGINFALKEFAKYHNFKDLQSEEDLTCVASQDYVSLTDSMDRIIEARVVDGTDFQNLSIKTKTWIVERWGSGEELSEGKPEVCYIESGKIVLLPIPDDTYTIRVTKITLPSDLSTDGASSPFGSLDYAICCWTAGYVMDSIERFDVGQAWRTRAMEALRSALAFDRRTFEKRQHEGALSVVEKPRPMFNLPDGY